LIIESWTDCFNCESYETYCVFLSMREVLVFEGIFRYFVFNYFI